MVGWKTTCEALAADSRRLREYYAACPGGPGRITPSRMGFVAVLLYRISHLLHTKRWRLLARLCWVANICLTGAEIEPQAVIGKGFVIPFPRTNTMCGRIGENCTFLNQSGTGGTFQGPRGLPVVGNNVLVMSGTLILGPIKIGDNVVIGPRCVVYKDVPEDGRISALPWRRKPLPAA
jgi:serine O-acetyltransferase